jgi:hypothetical protein
MADEKKIEVTEQLNTDEKVVDESESVNETADAVAMQLIEILIMKFKEKVKCETLIYLVIWLRQGMIQVQMSWRICWVN